MRKSCKKKENATSVSAYRKMLRSQYWRKQELSMRRITERTILFMEKENTIVITLKSTNEAESFSAIVNSKGAIVIE